MANVKYNENRQAVLVMGKGAFAKLWELLRYAPPTKERDRLMDEIHQQTGAGD